MDLLKLTVIAALAAPAVALAAPKASDAWSRPAAAGTTGAGFMTLSNPDKAPDALTSVEAPWAGRVEIHRSMMSGGMSSMQKQPRVALAPGGKVLFAPGGYHLMFLELKQPLKIGDRLPATLVFASGARVKTEFEVRITPPGAPSTAKPGATPDHAHH
ncbi:copper chaperone PCu(A)C [Phenylobacterium sp. J426]|uniref:copper chaperone PCu(A)C n=1 Tax=Phenylobacterium sp. J426 TaxID=2898439 RepID=UPI002150F837|nr:copper chaperone PCu(A)C [Phenylobacterium sp. J426]MCR5873505.1 copper chaperone PCu(A)C [Phenylobacterium sp. J426]